MTRREAEQAILAVTAGAMDPEQKTTPTKAGGISLMSSLPQSLTIYLNWKTITVHRGDESVTLDQDELFRALKGKE
jgi:hypothetical protein